MPAAVYLIVLLGVTRTHVAFAQVPLPRGRFQVVRVLSLTIQYLASSLITSAQMAYVVRYLRSAARMDYPQLDGLQVRQMGVHAMLEVQIAMWSAALKQTQV